MGSVNKIDYSSHRSILLDRDNRFIITSTVKRYALTSTYIEVFDHNIIPKITGYFFLLSLSNQKKYPCQLYMYNPICQKEYARKNIPGSYVCTPF